MQGFDTNTELATILESITDAFFALDNQWHFVYVNSEAERVLQRSKEELLGSSVWKEFPEAVGSTFYTEYHRAVEDQATVEFEEYYPPLETWFEVKAYPSEFGLAVYFRDINRRKRAEEELRRSEERLRAILVQYGSDIISVVEADGTIRFESPASKPVLGYSPEELVVTNAFDRIHPEDLESAKAAFAEILESFETSQRIETRFRHADGSWRHFEVVARNLLEDPEVQGVVINSRDITERKRAEKLLHERSEAIEASIDGVSVTDLEVGHTYVNQAHASTYGYDRPEELLGKSWEVLYDEERARWLERHALSELEKAGHWRGETVGKRRDGSTFDQEVSLTALDERRVVCVVRDITGRKEAERDLRESRARLQEAQRVANIGSWEYFPRGDRAVWSEQLYRIFGISYRKRAPRYREFVKMIHPQDRRMLHELFQDSLRRGTHRDKDFRIIRADGETRWVNAQYELSYKDGVARAVGTVHDITGRKQTEGALEMSEASLAEAQRIARVGSWEASFNPRRGSQTEDKMNWSIELYRIFGFEPQEVTPSFDEIIEATHPEDREWIGKAVRDATVNREPLLELEHRILHRDGEVRVVQAKIETRYDAASGRPVARYGTILDITDFRQAQEDQARLAAIVESSQDAIFSKTLDGIVESWNAGAEKLYGYSTDEMVGQHVSLLVPPELPDEVPKILDRVSRGEDIKSLETERLKRNGERVEVALTVSPMRSPSGEVVGASTIARDITGRKALERQLEYQAFHDLLTGLPNRALFEDRMRHALSRVSRREEYVALLFMDLDDFKVVNDSLGHLVGDQLLVAVARRLESILRAEDTVARFSGDEFVILLEGAGRAEKAELVAARVIETLREPFVIDGGEVSTTVSVGISNGMSHEVPFQDEPEELMRRADVAMYEAKTSGRGNYRVFEQEMGARAEQRQVLGNDLRRAVAKEELVLHYQPKIEIASGEVIGMEALVRWNHPERGLMLPAGFVPLAEETGMIVPVGRRVFRNACEQAKAWHDQHPKDPPTIVCVNVSAREFQNPDLVQEIAESLRETGASPACMELEITESTLMQYGEGTFKKLEEIRALGVNVAIDDFGTGYSSLSYLRHLPANYLKIDRSFVSGLAGEPEAGVLLSTIIDLARSMNMRTVAEGVETETQLKRLKEMGCDVAQGYYFARPQPAEEASEFLMEHYGPRSRPNLR